jgi:uncharacterized protein (DUF433 family)
MFYLKKHKKSPTHPRQNFLSKRISFYLTLLQLNDLIMAHFMEFIETNPKIMLGKPVIKGTRITVQQILESLGAGESMEDLLEAHPHISRTQILAVLQFASAEIGLVSMSSMSIAA